MTSPTRNGKTSGYSLVTGASAGIGTALARELARRGHDLILTARREDRLRDLAEELQTQHQVAVEYVTVDLAERGGPDALLRSVEEQGLEVTLLINNAGFGLYGSVIQQDRTRIEQMIRLNIETLTVLSQAFARKMVEKRHGGIINVASTAAFTPCPNLAVYGATKAYVLSLGEAMAVELQKHGVRVMTLCPGQTTSEFQEVALAPKVVRSGGRVRTAEQCAKGTLDAYEAGQVVYVDGKRNKLQTIACRVLPLTMVRNVAKRVLTPPDER